jgi:N-acetylmuramoyl-L-alanine amidase
MDCKDRKLERKKLCITLFSCVFFLCIILAYIGVKQAVNISRVYAYTVVIDAGHGGIDGGVSGVKSKVKESDLNLEIAKKLKVELALAGVKTVMTRTGYGGLYGTTAKGFKMRDMKARVKIINSSNADAFVSIHLNYYSDNSRRGAIVFYGDEKGKLLAQNVQEFFNKLSSAKRELSPLKGDYYLLNTANCPSIICECGFLSNAEEEKLLLLESYQTEIAKSITQGILTYLMGENNKSFN